MTGLTLVTGGQSERAPHVALGGLTVEQFRQQNLDRGYPEAMIENDIDDALNWPDVLPDCPTWCAYRDRIDVAHDYDGSLSGDVVPTFMRSHTSGRSDPHLTQDEYSRGGVVTHGAVVIAVGGDGVTMTTAEGRRYALLLLTAATELDNINGQVGS